MNDVIPVPDSRGSVRLQSSDPARALTQTQAFGGIVVEEAVPGATVTDDTALEAYILETGDTLFHPVGTCRMGMDTQAVVDSRLRVRKGANQQYNLRTVGWQM